MKVNGFLLLAIISIGILFSIQFTENAFAHSTKIAGDYKIEVGWIHEPPVLKKPNAIVVIIKLATDYDKQEFDLLPASVKGDPNEVAKESDTFGLSDMLDVEIELGEQKTALLLSESSDFPGEYFSEFTPKASGTPNVYIYGIIKNTEFESKFRIEKVSQESFIPMDSPIIPSWIKLRAGWWADQQIPDSDFVAGLEYLIKENILNVPETKTHRAPPQPIPEWVRNVADWWSKDMITDTNFIEAVQFLIEKGIIHI